MVSYTESSVRSFRYFACSTLSLLWTQFDWVSTPKPPRQQQDQVYQMNEEFGVYFSSYRSKIFTSRVFCFRPMSLPLAGQPYTCPWQYLRAACAAATLSFGAKQPLRKLVALWLITAPFTTGSMQVIAKRSALRTWRARCLNRSCISSGLCKTEVTAKSMRWTDTSRVNAGSRGNHVMMPVSSFNR